jgi:uncharacterized membrane-anchored protein
MDSASAKNWAHQAQFQMHVLEDTEDVGVLLAAGMNQILGLLQQLKGKLARGIFGAPCRRSGGFVRSVLDLACE